MTDEERTLFRRKSLGLLPDDVYIALKPKEGFIIEISGWPFRSLYCCRMVDVANLAVIELAPRSISTPDIGWITKNAPERLPTGVLWWGMLANMGTIAANFSVFYFGLAFVRYRRRVRRGACWKCGYMSKSAAICPECGKAR